MTTLFILYGSATGNSSHIAKSLSETLPASHPPLYTSISTLELNQFKRKVQPSISSPPATAPQNLHPVIMISSTTGNGDAPENAGRFMRLIKKEKKPIFEHCGFAVLGLGDTNYDKFCAVGKTLDKKWSELGGARAMSLGMADEATGLEDVVEPWKAAVLEALIKCCIRDETKTVDAVTTSPDVAAGMPAFMKRPGGNAQVGRRATPQNPVSSSPSSPASEEKKVDPPVPVPPPAKKQSSTDVLSSLMKNLNIAVPSTSPPESSLPSISFPSAANDTGLTTSSLSQRERSSSISTHSASTASQGFIYNHTHPYPAPILGARYLTNTSVEPAKRSLETKESLPGKAFEAGFPLDKEENSKRVLELTLGLPDDFTLEYQPGDSIAVLVDNRYAPEYHTLLTILKDRNVLRDDDVAAAEDAIKTSIDITSSPVKKHVLAALATTASRTDERHILSFLSSSLPEATKLYDAFVVDRQLTVVDVLTCFTSCRPSMELLLHVLPPIAPRYYSIASSPLETPHKLKIALSIVDYEIGRAEGVVRRGGLATRHFEILAASLLAGGSGGAARDVRIPIFPKPTVEFRLPSSPATPLILIGPGTGVCPFVGFLSHKRGLDHERKKRECAVSEGTWRGGLELRVAEESHESGAGDDAEISRPGGVTHLFFGCRYPHHDYLYEGEWKQFESEGYLTNLHVAFSRAGPAGSKKCYVQHLLKEKGAMVADLIVNHGASVYLCGDGNHMAKAVQKCLIEVLEGCNTNTNGEENGGCDSAVITDGSVYLEDMKKRRKFLMDIWS